jgi:hypothetical protein
MKDKKIKLNKPQKPQLNKPAVIGQFAVSEILSEVQIGRAFFYYWKHKRYVDDMVNLTQNQFEPSQMEDKNDPMLWKAEYWKWFLANCR